MPAKSKAQQRFFGMVRAAQKGEMENPSSEVLDAADSISVKDAKKMAKTKHKGLPEKVDEASAVLDANTKIKNEKQRKKDQAKLAKLTHIYKGMKTGQYNSHELEGEVIDEARANAVIARRILQNKKKCADCGSYAHVTGASNCPSKKDPEGLPEGVMDIVRRYGKKKPEKKAQKAQDAGARLRRKVERRVHAKYVSGSEDNVPDELRDHKTWSEFKKYLAI